MISWSRMNSKIKHIQYALQHLGYDVTESGDADEKTDKAVREFQKNKSLVVDGVFGPLSQHEFEKETKRVQRHLVGVGMDLGKAGADGHFGPFTANAVKSFQKEVGLEENGVFCKKNIRKNARMGKENSNTSFRKEI